MLDASLNAARQPFKLIFCIFKTIHSEYTVLLPTSTVHTYYDTFRPTSAWIARYIASHNTDSRAWRPTQIVNAVVVICVLWRFFVRSAWNNRPSQSFSISPCCASLVVLAWSSATYCDGSSLLGDSRQSRCQQLSLDGTSGELSHRLILWSWAPPAAIFVEDAKFQSWLSP